MKTLKLLQRNLLYILLCAVFVMGCTTEETQPENTFSFTKEDIMVIYENGYKMGALNGLENGYYDPIRWQRDSLEMVARWAK